MPVGLVGALALTLPSRVILGLRLFGGMGGC